MIHSLENWRSPHPSDEPASNPAEPYDHSRGESHRLPTFSQVQPPSYCSFETADARILSAVSHGPEGEAIKIDLLVSPKTPGLQTYSLTFAGSESVEEPAYLLISSPQGLGAGGLFQGNLKLKHPVDLPTLYENPESNRTGCRAKLEFSAPRPISFSLGHDWAVGGVRESRDRVEGTYSSCPLSLPFVAANEQGVVITRRFTYDDGSNIEACLVLEAAEQGTINVRQEDQGFSSVQLVPADNGEFSCTLRFECTTRNLGESGLPLEEIFQDRFLIAELNGGSSSIDLSIFTSLIHGSPSADEEVVAIQEQGLLAGYSRFPNGFGRDPLLTQLVYLPHLKPTFAQWLMKTQLSRVLSPGMEDAVISGHETIVETGMACHEVTVGPYASNDGTSRLSYLMVDTTPLLVITAAETFALYPAGVRELLQLRVSNPWDTLDRTSYQEKLLYAIRYVAEHARSFAEHADEEDAWKYLPEFIHPIVGDWADSSTGNLGTTRTLAVASLYTAALSAATRLLEQPEVGLSNGLGAAEILDTWLPKDSPFSSPLEELHHLASTWRANYLRQFQVSIPNDEARSHIRSYCEFLGISDQPALHSLGDSPLTFYSMGLNNKGELALAPHAHGFFALFFTEPTEEEMDILLSSLDTSFPAGIFKEGIGPVISAPLTPELREGSLPTDYHINSSWPFMNLLLIQATAYQLTRSDLSVQTKERLVAIHERCQDVLESTMDYRLLELYGSKSITAENKNYFLPTPLRNRAFSPCAFQLWNTWLPAVRQNVADLKFSWR